MTLGDMIRSMNDEELAEFLQWSVPDSCTNPETQKDYDCFSLGCALNCTHDKRKNNMLKWVKKEINDIRELY